MKYLLIKQLFSADKITKKANTKWVDLGLAVTGCCHEACAIQRHYHERNNIRPCIKHSFSFLKSFKSTIAYSIGTMPLFFSSIDHCTWYTLPSIWSSNKKLYIFSVG